MFMMMSTLCTKYHHHLYSSKTDLCLHMIMIHHVLTTSNQSEDKLLNTFGMQYLWSSAAAVYSEVNKHVQRAIVYGMECLQMTLQTVTGF